VIKKKTISVPRTISKETKEITKMEISSNSETFRETLIKTKE
jgi:hypothetical protein